MKTQHEKVTNWDPPKPQKAWFYYSKTHVSKDLPYHPKVIKMTPKCSPNGSQINPMGPQRPLQDLPETNREQRKKKNIKKL